MTKEEILQKLVHDLEVRNQSKVMTLPAMEFIHRFLLHVLPPGFTKIRHYGFLTSAVKSKKLALCRAVTNASDCKTEKLSTVELIKALTGVDVTVCPVCGCTLSRASPDYAIA